MDIKLLFFTKIFYENTNIEITNAVSCTFFELKFNTSAGGKTGEKSSLMQFCGAYFLFYLLIMHLLQQSSRIDIKCLTLEIARINSW